MDIRLKQNIKDIYDIDIKDEGNVISFIINKADNILGYADKDYIRMTIKRSADKKYGFFRSIIIQIPVGKSLNYQINRYGVLAISILYSKIKIADMDIIVLE